MLTSSLELVAQMHLPGELDDIADAEWVASQQRLRSMARGHSYDRDTSRQ